MKGKQEREAVEGEKTCRDALKISRVHSKCRLNEETETAGGGRGG